MVRRWLVDETSKNGEIARARNEKNVNEKKTEMESMQTMTLNQLEGMWLTPDHNSSMWIGGPNQERVEICVNRKPVVSEHTHFEYDSVQNNCRISESVLLDQLFPDGAILVRFQIKEGLRALILYRRD